MIFMSMKSKAYDKLRSLIIPFDKILEEIPNEGKVLDIGSSHGTFTIYAAKTKRNISITGVEIDKKRAQSSGEKASGLGNIDFVASDFIEFQTNEKFDAITCLDVMHHMPRSLHAKVVEKSYMFLKPNGIFVLVEMNKKPLVKYLWNYAHDMVFSRTTKLNYIAREDAINMIKARGFSISAVKNASAFMYERYMIIAKKSV
jgi:2-polyprenyl-3-methyl-5-hydroxy-6-metoxy-1,4-benzoquinol methylase